MPRFFRIGIFTGVVGLVVATGLVFSLAALRMAKVGENILRGQASFAEELEMIGTVDLLLLGIGILIIAAGMISLTMRNIPMPRGLRFHDLHQLKSTFSSFLILIMAILYLESMASLKQMELSTKSQPEALLYGGLGFLAVTIGLVIFQRSGHHRPPHAPHPSTHEQG
ncbi:YqhA family protein [Cyanobium sp. FACHB-13342]|uniref:YqhA family protein n=1 Tax=Cyanobium sp. FACHB-13342 TaxID=2692793 RepID=UPI0016813268|nr:YqhA family protein [Cyanobium sp. FACHB-13342]MBD2423737.1 YqhA family protein [Cyanobium sp. FACHB-13342]